MMCQCSRVAFRIFPEETVALAVRILLLKHRKSIATIWSRRGNRFSLSSEERAGVRTGFLFLFTIFGLLGALGMLWHPETRARRSIRHSSFVIRHSSFVISPA